jgi:hypothetical protein
MPKWGLLQRLSGRASLANASSPSQVLQGSCKHTNGVANDAKNGLVDVAEETVGTLQEVVEVRTAGTGCILQACMPRHAV